jgi:hypothetical protein
MARHGRIERLIRVALRRFTLAQNNRGNGLGNRNRAWQSEDISNSERVRRPANQKQTDPITGG